MMEYNDQIKENHEQQYKTKQKQTNEPDMRENKRQRFQMRCQTSTLKKKLHYDLPLFLAM